MNARTERHMDEIDAAHVGYAWFHAITASLPPSPMLSVDSMQFILPSGSKPSGGVTVLWDGPKLIAQMTIVRDEMNFSVLTMVDFRETTP